MDWHCPRDESDRWELFTFVLLLILGAVYIRVVVDPGCCEYPAWGRILEVLHA